MDDRCIMENLLLTTKGAIDLYMHGAVEASTANVRQAFSRAFDEALAMDDTIYQQMTAKGWYQNDSAKPQEITQLKQKFTPTC